MAVMLLLSWCFLVVASCNCDGWSCEEATAVLSCSKPTDAGRAQNVTPNVCAREGFLCMVEDPRLKMG